MASAITHALVGVSLVSLVPRALSGRQRLGLALSLACLAMLPDLDVVGFHYGIPYEAAMGHRGFSHSLLFALLVAPVALLVTRKHALAVLCLAFAATLSHGVLDAMTDAGLGIGFFVPFAETRHFFSWRPLETSPLSPAAFFGSRGVEILKNEARWVLFPTFLAAGAIVLCRVSVGRARGAGGDGEA